MKKNDNELDWYDDINETATTISQIDDIRVHFVRVGTWGTVRWRSRLRWVGPMIWTAQSSSSMRLCPEARNVIPIDRLRRCAGLWRRQNDENLDPNHPIDG